MVNQVSNNFVSFRNTPVNYNKRKTPPMPQDTGIEDMFVMQQMMEQQRAKKEKSKERWYKTGVVAQVGLAAAFSVMAAATVFSLYKQFGKGAGINNLKFQDIAKKVDFPKIDDDCVNPKVRDFIKTIKNSSGLSEDVKRVSGAKNPEQFLLMYGPPGTGKTFSAKMMAKELGAEYAEVQFADVSSPYIGQTSVEIKKIFNTIAKKAEKEPNKKFLVAFNEIDALLVPREKCGANNLHLAENRTAFLNGLDQVEKFKNIKIVGTTNVDPNSGNLDKASLSRFGNMLKIELPTEKEIIAALKFHLKKGASAIDKHKFFETNESAINKFAKLLKENNYSQRDIEKLANDARNRFGTSISKSTNVDSEKFKMKFLQEAFDAKGITTGGIEEEVVPLWQKKMEQLQNIPTGKEKTSLLQRIKSFFKSEKS